MDWTEYHKLKRLIWKAIFLAIAYVALAIFTHCLKAFYPHNIVLSVMFVISIIGAVFYFLAFVFFQIKILRLK